MHGCGCGGREGTLRLLGVQARRCDERFCRLWMQASMIVQEGHTQPGETCWITARWKQLEQECISKKKKKEEERLTMVTEVRLKGWDVFHPAASNLTDVAVNLDPPLPSPLPQAPSSITLE